MFGQIILVLICGDIIGYFVSEIWNAVEKHFDDVEERKWKRLVRTATLK